MAIDNLLMCAGVSSPKKDKTEDAWCKAFGKGMASVILADGLGSTKFASQASTFCVNFINEKISHNKIGGTSTSAWIKSIFEECQKTWVEKKNDVNDVGNTTLLLANIDSINSIQIGYVGNGCIFHIRGNFVELTNQNNLLFPWCAMNYLNPHSKESKEGKEALYRYISNEMDKEKNAIPDIMQFSQDEDFGDVIIMATDGVFSNDQVIFGNNSSGVWQKVEKKLTEIFAIVKDFLTHSEKLNNNKESLEKEILNKLEEWRKNNEIDDDASIGILITKQAIEYNIALNQKKAISNEKN